MEAKNEDKLAKEQMKKFKDASRHVKDHDIEVGDLVIAKRKTTKHDSIYDPKPCKEVNIHGTQVKGMREDGKHMTRDSQRWKQVQVQARRRYADLETTRKYLDETDIGAGYQSDAGRVPGRDNRNDVYKAKGAGLDDNVLGVGAGLDNVVQGKIAGLDDKVQHKGA